MTESVMGELMFDPQNVFQAERLAALQRVFTQEQVQALAEVFGAWRGALPDKRNEEQR